MTSGYTRAVNDLMEEVDRMDDVHRINMKALRSDLNDMRNVPLKPDAADRGILLQAEAVVAAYDSLTAENQRLREAMEYAERNLCALADDMEPSQLTGNQATRFDLVVASLRAALKGTSK